MSHIHGMVKAHEEVIDREVKNHADEHLGKIKELVLDKVSGHIAYVVLDSGSFLGLGGKFFALPWNLLHFNAENSCYRIDIDKDRLKNAPGFDKDNWPDMADKIWGKTIYGYYGIKAYWE